MASAIIISSLVLLALLPAFALPHSGLGRAQPGERAARAGGERKPRQGPGSRAAGAEREAKDADGGAGDSSPVRVDADSGGSKKVQGSEDGKVTQDPKQLEELKQKLSAEQMNVCFRKGTEPPFSGKYYHLKDPGEYRCAVCTQPLFSSETKFDSGTGWPSFWELAFPGAVRQTDDYSIGLHRVEVACSACGSHLGHVFPDGPQPTGLRYCINSLSLEFIPSECLAEEDVA